MKIPKVLITAQHEEKEKERIYGPTTVSRDFDNFPFFKENCLPLVLPAIDFPQSYIKEAVNAVDIVVLPGGHDVDPIFYNEEVRYDNVQRYLYRDKLEMMVIEEAIKAKKLIFGICRGMQIINVYFGGTLYQNTKEQKSTSLLHRTHDINKLAHKINIEKDSFLGKVYSKKTIWINSFHNQSVKDLGKGLKIAAISSDGVIEAMEHTSYPIFAVQWHPEIAYNFDENSKKLFKYILSKGN